MKDHFVKIIFIFIVKRTCVKKIRLYDRIMKCFDVFWFLKQWIQVMFGKCVQNLINKNVLQYVFVKSKRKPKMGKQKRLNEGIMWKFIFVIIYQRVQKWNESIKQELCSFFLCHAHLRFRSHRIFFSSYWTCENGNCIQNKKLLYKKYIFTQ